MLLGIIQKQQGEQLKKKKPKISFSVELENRYNLWNLRYVQGLPKQPGLGESTGLCWNL